MISGGYIAQMYEFGLGELYEQAHVPQYDPA
jgi:hypothetical protein